MNKLNSAEIPLNDQTKFWLNEINKIKDYFSSEIQERKTTNKKLSKYIVAFYYIDKTLICEKRRNKYYFFYKCYWNSCRTSKCRFYFNIFCNYRDNKKNIERNKKEKEKTQ